MYLSLVLQWQCFLRSIQRNGHTCNSLSNTIAQPHVITASTNFRSRSTVPDILTHVWALPGVLPGFQAPVLGNGGSSPLSRQPFHGASLVQSPLAPGAGDEAAANGHVFPWFQVAVEDLQLFWRPQSPNWYLYRVMAIQYNETITVREKKCNYKRYLFSLFLANSMVAVKRPFLKVFS